MKAPIVFLSGAFAGLFALGAAIDLIMIEPIRRADRQMASLRSDLTDVDRRIAAARTALSAARRGLLPAASLTSGGNPAEVEARLQEQIGTALDVVGGMMLSSQIVTSDLGGGYRKISLLLNTQLSEEQLLALLEDVRQARPMVIVEQLDARFLPGQAGAPSLEVSATLTMFHADDTAA